MLSKVVSAQGIRVFRHDCVLIPVTADLSASLIAGKSEKHLNKTKPQKTIDVPIRNVHINHLVSKDCSSNFVISG